MRVFILLATVSLIIIFSILKYFEYREEKSEDCEGEWSWSECNKKCSEGGSVRYGTFNVTKEAAFDGKCEFKDGEQKTETCPASECPPEDCVGDWVWDTQCVGYCSDGDALLMGEYVTSFKEKYGGQACPHEDGDKDVKPCPNDMCPSEDCKISIAWEDCDKLCSTGESKRKGVVSVLTSDEYIDSCDYQHGQEIEESCPDSACQPENCQGGWVEDDACEEGLCSEGVKIRKTYKITSPAKYGGESCEYTDGHEKFDNCPESKCPAENCEGVWEMDDNCSGPCGGPGNPNESTINETFKITKPENYKGTCENKNKVRSIPCPESRCPVEDCEGNFELLQLPDCDAAGENEACVKDGEYFSTKTDETGMFFPDGWQFQIYKSVGPFFNGNPCLFTDGEVIIVGVEGQYAEVSSTS